MGRERKRHVQQALFFGDKNGQRRGNAQNRKRTKGVRLGRPPKGPRSSERHETRPAIKASEPVHVTLRAVPEVGRLRTRAVYKAVREALFATIGREDCRIAHLSIQGNHVHLLVEADNRMALARGMQAFQISGAKHINAAVSNAGSWWERRQQRVKPKRRRGQVFGDRYHAEIIRTPRQARHALAYVLNNWRRHREDRAAFARGWLIDPFSTGWSFDGWKEREDEPFVWTLRASYEPMMSWRPKTWLLREGWRRIGLIGVREVPGPRLASRTASPEIKPTV